MYDQVIYNHSFIQWWINYRKKMELNENNKNGMGKFISNVDFHLLFIFVIIIAKGIKNSRMHISNRFIYTCFQLSYFILRKLLKYFQTVWLAIRDTIWLLFFLPDPIGKTELNFVIHAHIFAIKIKLTNSLIMFAW